MTMTQPQMVAHDEKTFELMLQIGKIEARLASIDDQKHAMAGNKKRYFGRTPQWLMSRDEVDDKLSQMHRAGDQRVNELINRQGKLSNELVTLYRQAQDLEDVYRAAPWARYHPCTNRDGHIHASWRGCPSVDNRTGMSWETSLSGLPVEAAIDRLGPRLCSKCFPGAPAEWCRSLVEITREEREAKKRERQEAKYVKQLRPEEQFRDRFGSRVTTVAGCLTALREEVELRDYYGRGEHPSHAESVVAAERAREVLLAREAARPGTGASQEKVSDVIAKAVVRNRKEGARI